MYALTVASTRSTPISTKTLSDIDPFYISHYVRCEIGSTSDIYFCRLTSIFSITLHNSNYWYIIFTLIMILLIALLFF